MSGTVLRLTDVVKIYGSGESEVCILDHVSMELEAGEVAAVMGPSGSGKTTMLTIGGALQRPTSGTVEVLGRQIQDLSQSELSKVRREKIGFVFQGFNLLQALTAYENVEYALGLAGQHGKHAKERARNILELMGLGHRMDKYPKQLSGGEQQRVSIARAIANNASLLLADEPTASLDERRASDLMGLFHAIAHDQGVGILMVTHDLRAHQTADRILWLEGGDLRPITHQEVAAQSSV